MNNKFKAADIADEDFLLAIEYEINNARNPAQGTWATWGYEGADFGLQLRFSEFPRKVLLAKARRLIKRGLLTGCACGCRGDFELTLKGKELLEEMI